MKLMNFKAFDTSYNGKGLEGGSKLDEEVFNEYANQKELLGELAKGIKDAAKMAAFVTAVHGVRNANV